MLKENVLKVIARIGYKSALKAGGAASQYGIYQAKEPKELTKLRESK